MKVLGKVVKIEPTWAMTTLTASYVFSEFFVFQSVHSAD